MAQPALNIESEFNAAQHMLNQGRLDDAEKVLTRLKAIMAPHPVLFEYLGFIAHKRQDLKKAIRFYRKASKLDPSYLQSKVKLAEVLIANGDEAEAKQVAQSVYRKDPKNVAALNILGTFAVQAGAHEDARTFFTAATVSDPKSFQSWHNLGRLLLNSSEWKGAADALIEAETLQPEHYKTLIYLGCAYTSLGDIEQALSILTRARRLASSQAEFCGSGAYMIEAHIRAQNLDKALEIISSIETEIPNDPRTQSLRAIVYRQQGRYQDALDIIETLGDDQSIVEERWYPNELEAHCLQSLGRHDEAAQAFVIQNQRQEKVFARLGKDKTRYIEHTAEAQAIYSEAEIANWSDLSGPDDGRDLFFINGFPRSGTTLIDAVLRTHSAIAIAEESNAANQTFLAAQSLNPATRMNLAKIDRASAETLREHYFGILNDDLSTDRLGKKVVDRHATGLVQAGLMKRLFPQAQFFLMLRHPCDVVLSAWSTNFHPTNHTANYLTIEDTAQIYDRLMTIHSTLESKLAVNTTTIRYEDLVADLRGTVEPVLTAMGLEWEDQMERFHESEHRPNRTASYNQVSKPIYKAATYRFEKYKGTLEPVMPILEPWIERFGY